MSALDEFQSRLGHRFKDMAHLEQALRHASLDVENDNEHLEFLGDRVLGLVIADYLVRTHADESEGDLARRHAQLVSRKTCAHIAREIELAAVLRTDAGIRQKGDVPRNVLADGCEAVLGAVFVDAGLEAARDIILQHWQAYFAEQVSAPIDNKTALQEWLMQRARPLPSYEIIDRSGPDHAPEFTVAVACDAGQAQGEGPSRKLAEQRAAAALLQLLEEGHSE
jgi:ribonuclease-3